jgi:hypothetical protein
MEHENKMEKVKVYLVTLKSGVVFFGEFKNKQPRLVRLSFWYFLRWLRGPVGIAQGVAQTLSLGCWEPSWILKMEGWFLDYSWEVRDLIQANARAMPPATETDHGN